MKRYLKTFGYFFLLLIFTCFVKAANCQVGIGVNPPDSSAMLEVSSTIRGFLPPRMSSTQILAIRNPQPGLMVYNTFYKKPVFYNGTAWKFYCNDSTMGNGDLSKSLIAYFPFNGNFNDESGKGNHGTPSVSGGSLTSDNENIPNTAFNCNGNGQELIVNNNGNIQFDSILSISCNVMLRNSGRFHFVNMVKYSNGAGTTFSVGTNLPNTYNAIFSVANNTASCTDPNIGAQSTNQNSNLAFVPGTWYNLVCTYSKSVMKMYINGVLYATQNSPTQSLRICSGTQVLIGGWWQQDPDGSLNGKIDEVRLYNRLLSSDEINELSGKFR